MSNSAAREAEIANSAPKKKAETTKVCVIFRYRTLCAAATLMDESEEITKSRAINTMVKRGLKAANRVNGTIDWYALYKMPDSEFQEGLVPAEDMGIIIKRSTSVTFKNKRLADLDQFIASIAGDFYLLKTRVSRGVAIELLDRVYYCQKNELESIIPLTNHSGGDAA